MLKSNAEILVKNVRINATIFIQFWFSIFYKNSFQDFARIYLVTPCQGSECEVRVAMHMGRNG